MKRVLIVGALVLFLATTVAADSNVVIIAAKGITDALALIGTYVDGLETLLTYQNTGATPKYYTSVGLTEDKHAVKTSAGVLYSVTATNTNASERYIRCADASLAGTTPSSTTPIFGPAIPGADSGNGLHLAFPEGWAFSTALTCWIVTGAADNDVAEVAADEIKVFYTYK